MQTQHLAQRQRVRSEQAGGCEKKAERMKEWGGPGPRTRGAAVVADNVGFLSKALSVFSEGAKCMGHKEKDCGAEMLKSRVFYKRRATDKICN